VHNESPWSAVRMLQLPCCAGSWPSHTSSSQPLFLLHSLSTSLLNTNTTCIACDCRNQQLQPEERNQQLHKQTTARIALTPHWLALPDTVHTLYASCNIKRMLPTAQAHGQARSYLALLPSKNLTANPQQWACVLHSAQLTAESTALTPRTYHVLGETHHTRQSCRLLRALLSTRPFSGWRGRS
jgi:hypothetical protein